MRQNPFYPLSPAWVRFEEAAQGRSVQYGMSLCFRTDVKANGVVAATDETNARWTIGSQTASASEVITTVSRPFEQHDDPPENLAIAAAQRGTPPETTGDEHSSQITAGQPERYSRPATFGAGAVVAGTLLGSIAIGVGWFVLKSSEPHSTSPRSEPDKSPPSVQESLIVDSRSLGHQRKHPGPPSAHRSISQDSKASSATRNPVAVPSVNEPATGASGLGRKYLVGENQYFNNTESESRELKEFILQFVASGDTLSPMTQANLFYAKTADYFDRGVLTQSEIAKDIFAFRSRFQSYKEKVSAEPLVMRKSDNEWEVQFSVLFSATGTSGRRYEGKAEIQASVTASGPLQITRIVAKNLEPLASAKGGAAQTRYAAAPEEPKQRQSSWERPGTKEAAIFAQANKEIDAVYQKLMGSLDQDQQTRLRSEQRAWLRSRDTEAERIAHQGGAVGGSAFRIDYLSAQVRLTRQRTEVLKNYFQPSAKSRVVSPHGATSHGIPKGPAADATINELLGNGAAESLNNVERSSLALETFVRLFLSHTDNGNYAEAYKMLSADSFNSAADLETYMNANPAFEKQIKRPDRFNCKLHSNGIGGKITIPVTSNTGVRYTIEVVVEERLNRLLIRRIFVGREFP